jgi:predicted ABC-type ATPase
MNRIVETLQESQSLIESWGDVIDVTEFMTDTPGFFQANSLGVYTQIYDRADGRYRPVYTNESDLKIIRAMSWLLVERVPMAQAWINRLLDYTIGTGFDWTIKAEDKRLEKAIQAYVRETLDNSKWSSELERESYAREVGEGECILEHVYENGQCLAIACEADELTEPESKGELEDWIGVDFVPSWTFGVLTRESRPQNPIGYHFCRNQTGSDWDYLTADKVSHWKRNVRARAKRGFSDFYKPHLYLLRADRVLTNTAEGAATQAAIAYIVEHKDGTQRQADNIVKKFAMPTGRVDPLTGIMERKRKMKPGTRLDVPEGQTYKAGLLGANNSGIYIEVMEAALRLGGSVHAFVEGMLTGSYSNNNFASALVAEGPFMQGRLAEQSQRKERMREMILKMIRLGAGKRRFAAGGYESWDSIRDAITVEVIPSRIVPMDPLKTAQALAIQKQNGWVSDKTCINELGRDIDTETANGLKVGGAENQAGVAGQNAGPQGANLGNVSKDSEPESSLWLGLSRQQWQRNRKAVSDVLTDFANGKTRRSVAVALLRAIGMPEQGIQTILRDASDGRVDSLPPEQMESLTEAERKTLNKPFRTSGGPKKFSVYVKNQKGNVVKVNFGDPKMRIKRDDPGSRRGFRARHNCQDPGPKWKARYWSCRMWSKPSVTKILKESLETGEIGWDGRTFVRESWLYRQNPRLLEVRDGDGDGKINDGKPSEAPAEKKNKKKSNTVNPKVLEWAKKKFKDDSKAQNFAEWFGDSKVVDADGNPLVVYHGTASKFDEFSPDKGFSTTDRIGSWFGIDSTIADQRSSAHAKINADKAGQSTVPVFLNIEKPLVLENREQLNEYIAKNLTIEKSFYDKDVKDIFEPEYSEAPKYYIGKSGDIDKYYIDNDARYRINMDVISGSLYANDLANDARKTLSQYDGVFIKSDQGQGSAYVAFDPAQIKSATGNKGTFNPNSNKINESFREAKDGDGDGLFEAFCATGEKGGVKNDCPPKAQPRLPKKPTFVSSDAARNADNDRAIFGLIDMFNKADVSGLRAVDHPSPKVQEYAKSLRRSLAMAGIRGDNPIDLFGSTEAMHTENGKYTEKRRKLHAQIYEQLLAGAEPVENPTFVLLGGGSASGKSALVAGTVPAIPASLVRVDADQIKSMLPEYAALSGSDSRAAAFAHNESAFMAKELASIAASRSYNTMLDGTGNGSEGGLAKKVGIAKKQGMKVVAVYATTDLQTAIARNKQRAKTDGRMVPQSFLEFSHQQVSSLFPRFVRNGSFDEAHLYDTTGDAKKIATYQNGSLEVHDPKAYRKFLDKAGR